MFSGLILSSNCSNRARRALLFTLHFKQLRAQFLNSPQLLT